MGVKSKIIIPFAKFIHNRILSMASNAVRDQEKILHTLVKTARDTAFGKDHNFGDIRSYEDFKKNVPIRDYEELRPYVESIISGEDDILWPGKPKYFAKTSGTTSGVKYIPITKDGIPNHMNSARNALMCYISETGKSEVVDGRIMFLSGSPVLEEVGGIPTGRLSGIVNHEVPTWVKGNQMPSYATNCIEDWEQKVDRVVDETLREDMRLIGGIPPWVQMYYEKLLEKTGKTSISEIFPNFSLFVYGGVNYEPYRAKLEQLVGKKIDSIEYYPASEGFLAFQISQEDQGLLLNTDSGIFFEFVPIEDVGKEQPRRLPLEEVELDKDYALILSNNSGLWAYDIGDSVRFTSLDPYKLVVSGRVKHYISAFGEHVIGKEVEEALNQATGQLSLNVVEFTVAPQTSPTVGLPYHEWFIEFDREPANLEHFSALLNAAMVEQNIYYKDLIDGKIIRPAKVNVLNSGAFRQYMRRQGKLGGQNKVPRLTNDRKIADVLQETIAISSI